MGKRLWRVGAILTTVALVVLVIGTCLSGCKKGGAGSSGVGVEKMKGSNEPNPDALNPNPKKGGGGGGAVGKKKGGTGADAFKKVPDG